MSDKQANRRIRLLLALFVLAFAGTLARAVWLQGVNAAHFARMAQRQHRETVTIPAGLGFYPEERRSYPQRTVAAQVVGYAGVDNRGLGGIEVEEESALAGKPGKQTIVRDPFGRAIDVVSATAERAGSDVFLTIDHTIQANAEAILRQTVAR